MSEKKRKRSPETAPVKENDAEESFDGFLLDTEVAKPTAKEGKSSPEPKIDAELVAGRVAKRLRTPLKPLEPIKIPSFRVIESDVEAAPPVDERPTKKAKKAKAEKEERSAHEEDEEVAGIALGIDEDEEESSESISLHSDFSNEDKAEVKSEKIVNDTGIVETNKRGGPHGKSAASRYTRMSENWDSFAAFPKNTVPNLMRLARIMEHAMKEHRKDNDIENESDNDDDMEVDQDSSKPPKEEIRFTKEAIPVFENYVSIRLSQIMESTSEMLRHRGEKKRMNANDVNLAIRSNPRFMPFNFEAYLQAHRDEAPAAVSFTDLLRVGKSNEKTQRCVFQHTDVSHKL